MRTVLIILIIFSFSCSKKPISNTFIQQQVSETFDAYVNQLNTQGLEGIDTFFSTDSLFYWVEDGVIQYENHQALQEGIAAFAPTVESVHFQPLDKKISVIDHNHASMFIRYKQDLVLTSGFSFTLDGAITILLTQFDGEWKFLNGHSSVLKPRGN